MLSNSVSFESEIRTNNQLDKVVFYSRSAFGKFLVLVILRPALCSIRAVLCIYDTTELQWESKSARQYLVSATLRHKPVG